MVKMSSLVVAVICTAFITLGLDRGCTANKRTEMFEQLTADLQNSAKPASSDGETEYHFLSRLARTIKELPRVESGTGNALGPPGYGHGVNEMWVDITYQRGAPEEKTFRFYNVINGRRIQEHFPGEGGE